MFSRNGRSKINLMYKYDSSTYVNPRPSGEYTVTYIPPRMPGRNVGLYNIARSVLQDWGDYDQSITLSIEEDGYVELDQ